jgi:hypothetical protein
VKGEFSLVMSVSEKGNATLLIVGHQVLSPKKVLKDFAKEKANPPRTPKMSVCL